MSLDRVLNAGSVAVVGASRDEKKRGYQAIKALIESKYEGAIYPVNPHEESVLGIKCHAGILDIAAPVDLALITTPAHTIPGILEQCGKKGVAGAVIVAGGFGELGERGRRLQDRIADVARAHGIRIIGPNTSGMVNVHRGLNLLGLADIPRGDIALLSQSGNMALHIITEATLKSQKGFSYYVGVGNEADIKFHEYLEFLTRDPSTRAMILYVEGMSAGRAFLQQARKTTLEKPVVLLKSGRSGPGRKSVGSHTGALAGMSEVARTAFARAGIVTIQNSDELFPVAEALASLPPIKNNRVAILADGGGHATLAADALTDLGVRIPELARATRAKLAEILSPNAALRNPVDVAGSTDSNPAVFADCARILLDDQRVGGLLLVGLFGGYAIRFSDRLRFIEEDTAHRLGKLVRSRRKPILVHSLYKFARPHSHELLRYYGIPVNDSVDVSCRCVAALSEYGRYLGTHHRRPSFVFNWGAKAKPEGREVIDRALQERRYALLEPEAKRLLGLHGAPVSDENLATSAAEAVRIAARMKEPVALKIVSPDILHKTDAGGVRLGLEREEEVATAFEEILQSARRHKPDADLRGCVVSPMAEPGTEVIVGTKIDDQFGPVIMFGIGGILVEVLKDVSFRVLPISRAAAREMISEIRSAAILGGYRGRPPLDKHAIQELLLTVSEVVEAYPEIQEMDLNPVIVRPKGLSVVDARILLRKNNRRNG
jgi:acyl-CoA synthetase (NDP forming)